MDTHDDGRFYHFDAEKLKQLKVEKPWMKDPKYFQSVAVSPSAVMKIMMHCQSGVEKGIAKGGNPIEVMGMLLGRPDPISPRTLVVTDAFPLPIEGFETRVVADDDNVVNHMITLGESLERSRLEKFMGWYHSHPFDYMPGVEHSHCFLSQTDLSTQLQWQRAEDPHGNPFVAIVVDPQRSTARQNPEMKAFRAYPPEYNSPVTNECPDGSVDPSEQVRLEKWGSCWNRYYELKVEYFMSQTSRKILKTLTQDYLWIRNFTSTPQAKVTEQLKSSTKQFQIALTSMKGQNLSSLMKSHETSSGYNQLPALRRGPSPGIVATTGIEGWGSADPDSTGTTARSGKQPSSVNSGTTSTTSTTTSNKKPDWNKAVVQLSDIALEQLAEMEKQSSKQYIFS